MRVLFATDGSESSNAALVILDEAHRESYDLVVVGSSGLNPVEEAVLGSTGDAVARNTRAALVGRTPRTAESKSTRETAEESQF